MKAIGVREFASFIRGELSLDAAVAKAKTESRRYAKRQIDLVPPPDEGLAADTKVSGS